MIDVRHTLAMAKAGLDSLESDGPEQLSGLRTVVVFGVAVTQALQNLRPLVDGFDAWYAPYRAQLRNDEAFRYMWKLRSVVLKEGSVGEFTIATTTRFTVEPPRMDQPPPGAKSFFFGGASGRSGWVFEDPDGTERIEWVTEPGSVVTERRIHFGNDPQATIAANDVLTLSRRYLLFLEGLVADAERRFDALQPSKGDE